MSAYQSLSTPVTESPVAVAKGAAKPESRRKLNLGSGLKRLDDAVNLDITSRTQPDVVHDLNIRPWPFPDKSFDEIVAYDVIEHLPDTLAVMEEIHRISANGAVVKITLPHFSCSNAFTDPTHVHYFGWFSFHYFTGENEFPFYTQARFRRVQTTIQFVPSLFNKVVWRLANRFPKQYESRWAWLFPAWYLYFELTVIS